MTRDDIIRMAREAGAITSGHPEKWDVWVFQDPEIERFAALVAAAERDACAQIAEEWYVSRVAYDIRARSKT